MVVVMDSCPSRAWMWGSGAPPDEPSDVGVPQVVKAEPADPFGLEVGDEL